MKKSIGIMLAALALISCGNNTDQEGFPSEPTDGQTYERTDGSRGVWNAMMGYWMISSIMNGNRAMHHYYPSNNSFTDASGKTVARPTHFTPKKASSRNSGFGKSGRSRSAIS